MAEKLDPFDVGALEKSLNDSATRVSTIWVTFLIFSLYLLIAAGTVEHRQLFLAEPLKLPVLNIDLPLWWFFVLAPVLFVIFHFYVLLQVLLLGRTAAAYDDAVKRTVKRAYLAPDEDAALRQRLANTLFAQIFAGSPREREGWLGRFLEVMAWITLAIAPISILLAMQIAFLPYHSHVATWMHRLLIALELAAFFLIWPLVLDARRDLEWTDVRHLKRAAPIAAGLLFAFDSLCLATFPGEPHVNLFMLRSPWAVQCERWFSKHDRLILPGIDVVDDEKLAKIQDATKRAGQRDYQGERTKNFGSRDLNCGTFTSADLRRAELDGARLQGASFYGAQLQGASLHRAQLQGAEFDFAQLQGAWLSSAQLPGASLYRAQLQGAILVDAQLQGASLDSTELQGASLIRVQLQGASLDSAQLQGATLDHAQLQGASLDRAQLQGASLDRAQLQGASLDRAQLQGASLVDAQLQGADLGRSSMAHARFSGARVWRAQNADCAPSRVNGHKSDPIVAVMSVSERADETVRANPDEIAAFIERSVAAIPDPANKERVRGRMRASLDPTKGDTAVIAAAWSECEAASATPSRQEFDQVFDKGHAEFLRQLVCADTQNGKTIAKQIIRNWISGADDRRDFSTQLARDLLGPDGNDCPGTKDIDESDKQRLRRFAPASAPAPTPAPIQQ